jgi:hypothetical protein
MMQGTGMAGLGWESQMSFMSNLYEPKVWALQPPGCPHTLVALQETILEQHPLSTDAQWQDVMCSCFDWRGQVRE